MLDALLQGLSLVLQWNAFSLMLVGMALGFVVGLLPGIGGAATLALMLPFVFKMTPVEAFAFLLGMHSVAATTGDITSILFGVPGEGLSAATVVDGHPMAKRGEAARALGAALMSSLVGAVIGAIALAVSIPVVRPLVLTFGSPELFMLAIVGIAFVIYAEAHIADELMADALRDLHAKQGSVKFLGSYPAAGAHAHSARGGGALPPAAARPATASAGRKAASAA